MQETGNKTLAGKIAERVLSIRVAADGLSFSCPFDVKAAPEGFFDFASGFSVENIVSRLIEEHKLLPENFPKVEIEVDTNRIVLIPNTMFEEGMEENYLKANKVVYGRDEMTVVSPAFGIRAVMVAPRPAVEYLRSVWPGLTFTSPILKSIYRPKRGTVELNLTPSVAYLTVIEDKLNFAEAFPYSTSADLMYYIQRLGKIVDLQNSTILVLGHGDDAVIKLLSKYYRSVIGNAHYQWQP